jgi:hypothetical protein
VRPHVQKNIQVARRSRPRAELTLPAQSQLIAASTPAECYRQHAFSNIRPLAPAFLARLLNDLTRPPAWDTSYNVKNPWLRAPARPATGRTLAAELPGSNFVPLHRPHF